MKREDKERRTLKETCEMEWAMCAQFLILFPDPPHTPNIEEIKDRVPYIPKVNLHAKPKKSFTFSDGVDFMKMNRGEFHRRKADLEAMLIELDPNWKRPPKRK